MSYGGGGGEPPWEDEGRYLQQGYGWQNAQEPPWPTQQYDPADYRRHFQDPLQDAPWQRESYPEQDYRQQDYAPRGPWAQPTTWPQQASGPQQGAPPPPQRQQAPGQDFWPYQPPRRSRRSPGPLYAGLAALVLIAGGGAAYALTSRSSASRPPAGSAESSPAKPLTCKQQFTAWKTGPAKAIAQSFKSDGNALQSAANSQDIPALDSALKTIGNDATQLKAYPMPACADPAGDWTQILAGIKAAGDNANSASGLAGLMVALGPMQHVKSLETELDAELARTVGVKSAI